MTEQQASDRADAPQMASVLERNIQALLDKRRAEERRRSREERAADAITRFAGSMRFVYLHLLLFGGWVVVNLGWTPLPKFDPTFVVLAMFASVEAIFLSTFVLITQHRMAQHEDRRADLDLQISLLTEHELTRLIALASAIAARLGVREADHPELRELAQEVHPVDVLERIESETKRRGRPH